MKVFFLALLLFALPFSSAYQDQYTTTDFPYDPLGISGCKNDAYLPLFVCENLDINGTYLHSQKALRLRNVTLNTDNALWTRNNLTLVSTYAQAQYAGILIEDSLLYSRGDEDGEGELEGSLSLRATSIRIFDSVLNTYGIDGVKGDDGPDQVSGFPGTQGGDSSVYLHADAGILFYNVTWNGGAGRGGDGGEGGPDLLPSGCASDLDYLCTPAPGQSASGGEVNVNINASSLSIISSRLFWQAGAGGKSGSLGDVTQDPVLPERLLCEGGKEGGTGGDSTLTWDISSVFISLSTLNLSAGYGGDSFLAGERSINFCDAATSTLDGGEGGAFTFAIPAGTYLNISRTNISFMGGDGGAGGSDETTLDDTNLRCLNGGGKGGDATLLINASMFSIEGSAFNVSGGKGGKGDSCSDSFMKGTSSLHPDKNGGLVSVIVLGTQFFTSDSRLSFISKGAATLDGDSLTTTPFGNSSNVSVVFNLTTRFVAGNGTYLNVSAGRTFTVDASSIGNATFRVSAKGIYLGSSDGVSSGLFMTEKNSGFTNSWILLGDTPKLLVDNTFIKDRQGRKQIHPPPFSINITPAYCDGLHNVTFCIINDAFPPDEQSVNYATYPDKTHYCRYFKYSCANIWGDGPLIQRLYWHPSPTGNDDNLSLYVTCTDDGGALTVDYDIYLTPIETGVRSHLYGKTDVMIPNGILTRLNVSPEPGEENISRDDTTIGDIFEAEVICKDSDDNTDDESNTTTIRDSQSVITGCPYVAPIGNLARLDEQVRCDTTFVQCTNDGSQSPPGGFRWEYDWYITERSRNFSLFKDNFEAWTKTNYIGTSCPTYSSTSPYEHLWDSCVHSGSNTYISGFNHSYTWWRRSINKPLAKGAYLLGIGAVQGGANLKNMYLATSVDNTNSCDHLTLDFWNIKNKSDSNPTLDCFVYVSTDGVNYAKAYSSAGNTLGRWYHPIVSIDGYRGSKTYIRLNASGIVTAGYWKACGWDNFMVNCTRGDTTGVEYSGKSCNLGDPFWKGEPAGKYINPVKPPFHISTGSSNTLNLSGLDNFNSDNSEIICEARCALADIEEPDDFDWSEKKNSSNYVRFVQEPKFNKTTYILDNETMFRGHNPQEDSIAMIEFDDVDNDDDYLEMFIARGNYPLGGQPLGNYISLLSPTSFLFQNLDNSYYNRNRSWSLWEYGVGNNYDQRYIDRAPRIIKSLSLHDINSAIGKDLVVGANNTVVIYERTTHAYTPGNRATYRNANNHNFYHVQQPGYYNYPIMNFSGFFGTTGGYDIKMHDFDGDDVPELLLADANVQSVSGRGAVRFFNYLGTSGSFPPGFAYQELFNPGLPQLGFKGIPVTSTMAIGLGDFNGDSVTDVSSTENTTAGQKALNYYGAPVDYPSEVNVDLFGNGNWNQDLDLRQEGAWLPDTPNTVRIHFCSENLPLCPLSLLPGGRHCLGVKPADCYYDLSLLQDYIEDCDTGSSQHPADYSAATSSVFYGTCDFNLSLKADKGKVKVYDVLADFNMTNSPENTTLSRSDLAMALSNLLWKADCSSFEQFDGGDFSSWLFSGNPLYKDYCVVPITFCTFANSSSLAMNVSELNITYFECD